MALGLSIFLIITSVVMILLVLLHKGKGAGLSDLFGGGISSNYGGSSVVERNLDRITIVEVLFVEVVSVPAQWARQSAEIRLSAQQFHTGAAKDMKSAHHLQSKRL